MYPVDWQHHGFCRIESQKIATRPLKNFMQITVHLPKNSESKSSVYIWAITEKQGICFLNSGFVFWLLVVFFVELNVQIIRKNKQLSI
jgi:hypothetical protein